MISLCLSLFPNLERLSLSTETMSEGESHDLTHEVVHRNLKVGNISDGHQALTKLSKFTIGAQGRHDFNELSIWLVFLMTPP